MLLKIGSLRIARCLFEKYEKSVINNKILFNHKSMRWFFKKKANNNVYKSTSTNIDESKNIYLDILDRNLVISLKIVPIFVLIAIFHQFYTLIQLKSLVYFSWTQVIGDTIVFGIILFIVSFLVYYIWQLNWDMIKALSSDTMLLRVFWFENKILWSIFLVLFTILLLVLFEKFILIWKWLFILILLFLVFWTFLYYSFKNNIDDSRFIRLLWFIIVSTIFIVFYFFILNDLLYSDLYIDSSSICERVLYLNDRYVITDARVIHNSPDISFIRR